MLSSHFHDICNFPQYVEWGAAKLDRNIMSTTSNAIFSIKIIKIIVILEVCTAVPIIFRRESC